MSHQKLDQNQVKTLVKLVEAGPLHQTDLDFISREELVKSGHAVKVTMDGESGFIASTILGEKHYCRNIVGEETLKQAIHKRKTSGSLIHLSH